MSPAMTTINYELAPGICLGETACRVSGPRCEKGYCSKCCAKLFAHRAEQDHTPPPEPGQFRPLKAVQVGSSLVPLK